MSWLNGRQKEKRCAFVIGNADYKHAGALTSPPLDAEAVTIALKDCYFDARTGLDLTTEQMLAEFEAFENDLDDADVALLYYSGHGVQVAGENYLVPTDGSLRSREDLRAFPSVPEMMARMSAKAKKCIVILDACRNEPAAISFGGAIAETKSLEIQGVEKRTLEVTTDLAQDQAQAWGPDNYIAFATAPGTVAYEGQGGLSPFTEGVVRHITTRGIDIDELMTRARNYVGGLSQQQTVWINSALRDKFLFKARSYVPALVFIVLGVVAGLVAALTNGLISSNYGALSFAVIIGLGVWSIAPERSRLLFTHWRSGAMILFFAFLSLLTAVHVEKLSYSVVENLLAEDPQTKSLFDERRELQWDIYLRKQAIQQADKLKYIEREAFNLGDKDRAAETNLEAMRDQNFEELQKLISLEEKVKQKIDKVINGRGGLISFGTNFVHIAIFSFLIWFACLLGLESFQTLGILVAAFMLCVLGAILPYATDLDVRYTYISPVVAFAGIGLTLSYHVSHTPRIFDRLRPDLRPTTSLHNLSYWRIGLFLVLGAASGMACAFFTNTSLIWPFSQSEVLFTFLGISTSEFSPWSGLIFGGAMALAGLALARTNIRVALGTSIAIFIGWQIAQGLAVDLGDDNMWITVSIAGAVGAGVTSLGFLVFYDFRRAVVPFLLMCVLGALLTLPRTIFAIYFLSNNDQLQSYLDYTLFVPWQAGIAACIGAILLYLNPKPSPGEQPNLTSN